jgi:outer membrane lipoprotein-sorting protein
MPGTKEGAMKARETNLKKYGADFYKRIGSEGGKAGTGMQGFAHWDKDKLRRMSSEAGKRSVVVRRKKKTLTSAVTGDYIDIPLEEQ